MARPRTPTNILRLRGGFDKNPRRELERKDEPIVHEPLGPPPDTFDEAELLAWKDITRTAPAGVITEADRLAVETASRLLARERAGMNSDSNGRRFDNFLSKFGMTPSDRSKVRVSIPNPKVGNPFSQIS